MKTIIKTIWCISVLAVSAGATNYTVESGGGGNYTTIQACANAAVAGDSCTIFAGSYAGWTQPASGSAGSLITFIVNSGDTVTLTSGVTLTNRSYVRVSGFTLTGGGIRGTAVAHCKIDHNTFSTDTATSVDFNDVGGTSSTDDYIGYNTANYTQNSTNKTIGFRVHGDRLLYEHNTISPGAGDCGEFGGTNMVLRSNVCQHKNGRADFWGSNIEHIDFSQGVGSVNPPYAYSLWENNVMVDCTNDASNCHYFFVRGGAGFTQDSLIFRYNFSDSVDNLAGLGDASDGNGSAKNMHLYNNTAADGSRSTSVGVCVTLAANSGGPGAVLNNICHNMVANTSPTYYAFSGTVANANIAYDTSCTKSCTWGSPYTSEPTYAALHNQDPLFANLPNDGTLQAGSPARNAGVALTTVTAGCGTSSLTVGDPRFFQPGWGPRDNPIPGDQIRIGASSIAQITAINYSTNVLTLANSAACNTNDPVYLYTDTTGNVVFPIGQTNPDIGAFPFTSDTSPSPPSPPTGLTAIVH